MLKMSLRLFIYKKNAGSIENDRNSEAKRLGAKRIDGQLVLADNILYGQRGAHIHSDNDVGRSGDDTLFALADGAVKFEREGRDRRQASVHPKAINE